jgi:4-methyl-5(b-hydroxyethyl)-thiazole monophosphate biosynthesis
MANNTVLVPLMEGFEELEAIAIVDVLRRADIAVVTAGDRAGGVRGAHGIEIVAERALDLVKPHEISSVVMPGGMPGAKHLAENAAIQRLLKDVSSRQGYIAAICAAPMALARAGLHRGKRVTCYPGFQQHLEGATVVDEPVVIDGKLVTARGPGVAVEFALTLIGLLIDNDRKVQVAKAMLVG